MKKFLVIAIIALFVIFAGGQIMEWLSRYTWLAFRYLSRAIVYLFAIAGLVAVVRFVWTYWKD
ncbi:MAG: hypothetical protein LBC65_00805 [Oscillospiraceae bacterium]|jgi:predicted PurR-regulated permease PerM|nr:hypothetical protein [Oscillospiraceae bacterium]